MLELRLDSEPAGALLQPVCRHLSRAIDLGKFGPAAEERSPRSCGAVPRGRQERDRVDAAVVPQVRDDTVRLQFQAPAYSLATFMRTLALPKEVEHWSLTTLREKLVKIGAKVLRHGRYVTFQLADVAVPRELFRNIPNLIDDHRRKPFRRRSGKSMAK